MASPQLEDGTITARSGAQALVGYTVDVGQGDGCARATLEITEDHANRNGMLHGGLITVLMDAACGYTASMQLGGTALTPLVTVSLSVQFVAAARIGTTVTAKGIPAGGGRKIFHVHGELRDENERLIATALGVFKKTRQEN